MASTRERSDHQPRRRAASWFGSPASTPGPETAGRPGCPTCRSTDKTDPRVEAYGDVDEANSAIGVALATGELPVEIGDAARPHPERAVRSGRRPGQSAARPGPYAPSRCGSPRRTSSGSSTGCDAFGDPLPALRSFILPGGSPAAAQLHVARTVVRRAERAAWAAVQRVRHRTGATPRWAQSAGHHLSEPAVRPAVHPDPGRQRRPETGTCCGCPAGPRTARHHHDRRGMITPISPHLPEKPPAQRSRSRPAR